MRPISLKQDMDVRTALKNGIAELRDAHVPSFTLAAELLLLHTLGRDRTWLYAHPEASIGDADMQRFAALVARRAAGEPTQYLTGKQEFWGLEFEVTPDVLIPRPETEHVIEVALDRLALHEIREGRRQITKGAGLRIADIGTGSGCIAIALAKDLPEASFYATDTSQAALEVASRNAARHGVCHQIKFVRASLLDDSELHQSPVTSLPRSRRGHQSPLFDLIVSNPPYIGRREAASLPREVREHEPEAALYGGEEGYELYAELIAQATQRLKPRGVLVLELGRDSLPAAQPLLDPCTWTNVSVTNDLAGIARVIAAERLASSET